MPANRDVFAAPSFRRCRRRSNRSFKDGLRGWSVDLQAVGLGGRIRLDHFCFDDDGFFGVSAKAAAGRQHGGDANEAHKEEPDSSHGVAAVISFFHVVKRRMIGSATSLEWPATPVDHSSSICRWKGLGVERSGGFRPIVTVDLSQMLRNCDGEMALETI